MLSLSIKQYQYHPDRRVPFIVVFAPMLIDVMPLCNRRDLMPLFSVTIDRLAILAALPHSLATVTLLPPLLTFIRQRC